MDEGTMRSPEAGDDWRAEAEELRRRAPRHLLFLCMANSARSQIAEGVARSLAPEGVKVSSAGAFAHRVHEAAIRALGEIGVDASEQRSKAVEEIDTGDVDAVITLCAEQVCPAFLGKAFRVHWAFPDPVTAGGGDEATRLQAFRDVRDELRRRLAVVFDAEGPAGAP